jgi:hypothetical protein
LPEGENTGKAINDAMEAIEAENEELEVSSLGIQSVCQAKLQENTTNLNRLK